jgi:hypothetical protein
MGAEYHGERRVGSTVQVQPRYENTVARERQPPFIVMVRLDRTISLTTPVRASLGKSMARWSRTMTCYQRFSFNRDLFYPHGVTPDDDVASPVPRLV